MSVNLPPVNPYSNSLICVLGATGQQGKSVCQHLIQEGFKVRGTSRDASGSNCLELKKMGVEMVTANMDDISALQQAFKDCWAVYAVTDFYQPKVLENPELEYVQGKNAVDAAVASQVAYFMYSALDNVLDMSGGKLSKVVHFTNKSRVGAYAKSKTELKTILVYAAFYMQNFQSKLPPMRNSANELVFSFPISGSVRVPIVDSNDFGKVVSAIFKRVDEYVGREVLMCSEYISMNKFVSEFQAVTNQPAIYYQSSEEQTKNNLPPQLQDEFIEMFRWWGEYGYYGNVRDVDAGILECEKLVQQDNKHMNNFREWLSASGWKGPE